jgi:hypothetical protein
MMEVLLLSVLVLVLVLKQVLNQMQTQVQTQTQTPMKMLRLMPSHDPLFWHPLGSQIA